MVKIVSFMDMVLLNMNMLTDKALPSCPPRPDRIQANDLSIIGFVESRLAEAEPDMFPSSPTFMVNTVSSMDMAFMYMFIVPPTDEGFQDQDQVSVDSSSVPVAILSPHLRLDCPHPWKTLCQS